MTFDSLKDIPKKQKEYASAPKFSTLKYRYETLIERIENGTLSESQLRMDIRNNYKDYCNYDNFHDPSNRKVFQTLWTNKKFLNAFLSTIRTSFSQYNDIETNIRMRDELRFNTFYRTSICKIAYDYYYEIGKNNPDDEISLLQRKIVRVINYKEVLKLSTFMHDYAAEFILMANYSSFSIRTNIKRVNTFIVKLGYDFTVQNIIDIYSQLYTEDFGTLFNVTMTDNIISTNLTENQMSIFNRQNSAICTILNVMPEDEIKNVLNGYRNYCKYNNDYNIKRFNIYDLQEKDFPRIVKVLKE